MRDANINKMLYLPSVPHAPKLIVRVKRPEGTTVPCIVNVKLTGCTGCSVGLKKWGNRQETCELNVDE